MNDFVVVDNDFEGEGEGEGEALLDLSFSTSQTLSFLGEGEVSEKLKSDVEFELEQSVLIQARHCANHAPHIFYIDGGGKARLVEGVCNSWQCPRCGQIRARREFTRIIAGASDIAKDHPLYFWTFTCRGKEMSLEEAESNYLLWTNRLMTSARAKAARVTKKHPVADYWCYASVTERQQRGHPHSHVLTTFCPDDAIPFKRGEVLPNGRKAKHDTLWSEWYNGQVKRSGLGSECEISAVASAVAVAAYVAKYLFKSSVNTVWPKGWRRVRYGSWPKLHRDKNETAIPLIKHVDWLKLEHLAPLVFADSLFTYERALAHGVYNVIPPSEK